MKTDIDNKLKSLNELSKTIKLLSSKDYGILLGRLYFTSDDGFQNMFFYQTTFNMIKYKNSSAEYVINWKVKGVYNNKLIALDNYFLPNMKYFNKNIGIQFNNPSKDNDKEEYV